MFYDFWYSYVTCCFVFWKVYARKEALKGGLDKTVSLQKDLSEMDEWMTQAEEEYLERDFEYKTPDELQRAVDEMKVSQTPQNRAKKQKQRKLHHCLKLWFHTTCSFHGLVVEVDF